MNFITYQIQEQLKPTNLNGISQNQIDDHWNLYVGYVNQVNKLNQELSTLDTTSFAYADRRRRYGFEYNGMVLHEYYFANLRAQEENLAVTTHLYQSLEKTWGSFQAWQQDFINTGKSRGIGWAVLYMDPETKQLTNHFIMDHESGPIATFIPVLVMDVWEHAYMVDHKSGGRALYIEAFMKNINWNLIEERYLQAQKVGLINRYKKIE